MWVPGKVACLFDWVLVLLLKVNLWSLVKNNSKTIYRVVAGREAS